MSTKTHYDVIILGAGAAGLFCAIEAGQRGRRVMVIDHAAKPAEKVRISGGGRCNFTNLHAAPDNFVSGNPHFCKSALSRFTQYDFLERVEARGISWHEKTLGQLFCDNTSRDIVDLLVVGAKAQGAEIWLNSDVNTVSRDGAGYRVETYVGSYTCASLVLATGGLSIPKMGATGLAYDIARQFGLNIIEPRAGLRSFTFHENALEPIKALAGVGVQARASCNGMSFDEGALFTHRGLSGPAILQISSYWRDGDDVVIDLALGEDVFGKLKALRGESPKQILSNALATVLPKRLAAQIGQETFGDMRMADLSDAKLQSIAARVHEWRIRPDGTEGWRTAEVTLGGVDTAELSSRTMEASKAPGLYVIGEAVDVTGWLGGFNFQWAWSSAWAAGQVV